MRAALTHLASKLSKTSLRFDAFVCYVLVVKRVKFKTHLVFFLVVVNGFMDSHIDMNVNKFRIPTTKHYLKGEKCETFQGVNFAVY